ncbi:hypothetical protein T10_2170 [Trichinella papuae]|uniref:Uncharacterized protein n=1 Tax=Trichinella papuae TaxID=268474 RepID=A0A0V1M6Q2_9BILA|nr:hypothetical protein T10_2170 [Trichinella papuae]
MGGWFTAAPVPRFQTGELVQTCLEMQNIRFHASTVQHCVRITRNLSKHELLREFSSTLAKGFARILEIHTDSGTHRFLETSIPFCILGADLPGNFPRDVSIINHGCHLQKRLLAVLRVLCIWCVPACRRLFALAELKLDTPGNKDDSLYWHVREEFNRETKSGIHSSVFVVQFSPKCPFSSFLAHIYTGGVDPTPTVVSLPVHLDVSRAADHRSRDSYIAKSLTLGPINCGSIVHSLTLHQWNLAGLIAFQGQRDGYRNLGWPFDNAVIIRIHPTQQKE